MNFTKLNVGSRDFAGIYREPEWLNIDIEPHRKNPANFMQMDVFVMPPVWKDTFEVVHAVHVLEHINRNRRQEFVQALHGVTAPNGVVYIEVPDFKETVRLLHEAYQSGNKEAQHIWTTSVYGKQRSPGDQHCWGYTVETLSNLFFNAGFRFVLAWQSIKNPEEMISSHHKQEPVLLVKGIK